MIELSASRQATHYNYCRTSQAQVNKNQFILRTEHSTERTLRKNESHVWSVAIHLVSIQ